MTRKDMKRTLVSIFTLIALTFTLNIYAQDVEERIDEMLVEMSLEEKLQMINGITYFVNGVERLGIPALDMTDGPAGIASGPATAFPAPIALAASWDTALVRRVGAVIAEEAIAKGKNMLYAPSLNLFRNPLAGRNFESFGEDPYLTSRMAVAFVKGVQSKDVIAAARYFAVNTQEWGLFELDQRVDERSLREVYLPAYKAVVQEGNIGCIRAGYNMINGIPMNANNELINEIVRKEWGFEGFIAGKSGLKNVEAVQSFYDLDLLSKIDDVSAIKTALDSGFISMQTIDDKLRRILRVMILSGLMDQQTDPLLMENPNHSELALEVALKGIVLLKNDRGFLPLEMDKINSIALIGPGVFDARTSGGGTSYVDPQYTISPYQGMKNLLGDIVQIYTAKGIDMKNDVTPLDSSFVFVREGVNGFTAKYFNNMDCSGTPELSQTHKYIDFNWWHNPPTPEIAKDFSISWNATLIPPKGGAYKYKIVHNDGIRIYLDGKIILDKWEEGPVRLDSGWMFLEDSSSYDLQIDYYSNGGFNQVKYGFDYLQNLMIARAVEKASLADVAIVFVGLTDRFESVGFDRDYWGIPNQSKLIEAVLEVNPNTIVVIQTGSSVDIEDWAFDVPAILQAWYPGQEGGTAIAKVLFGEFDPIGRLPFTWTMDLNDYPGMKGYKSPSMRAWYKEGIHLGYRYMRKYDLQVRFPFGHGLSYTTFGIGKLMMKRNRDGSGWIATVEIKNVGSRSGTETLQLYVSDPESNVDKPTKELKAFQQVTLKPGHRKTVSFPLPYEAFSYFDEATGLWTVDPGLYDILIGTSAEEIKLQKTIELKEMHINP